MKTTGIFETLLYRVNVAGSEFKIIPFGDVHFGAPLHASGKFNEFCDWCKDQDPASMYYLGMGDYMDLISTSEREHLKSGIHESTRECIDDMYKSVCDKFAERIGFMKGRLIGMIEGNHYMTFADGTTSTIRLCQKLRTTYLGCTALIRLQIKKSSGECTSIDMFANHGQGGSARLVGGSLNRVQYMAEAADADIYLMGHDHKKIGRYGVPIRFAKHRQAGRR